MTSFSDLAIDIEPSAEQQAYENWALDEQGRHHTAAIQTCLERHGLDLRGVRHTELGDAANLVVDGEPWCQTDIAGLQFYDYGVWDELLEERVMPKDGDRLSLVRAPDNPHDANAVEVWFRNGIKLGHLPRYVASVVAGPLDRGEFCTAFIADGGTGEAWTAKAILIGEAVQPLHEKRLQRAVRQAVLETPLPAEEGWARQNAIDRRAQMVWNAEDALCRHADMLAKASRGDAA